MSAKATFQPTQCGAATGGFQPEADGGLKPEAGTRDPACCGPSMLSPVM